MNILFNDSLEQTGGNYFKSYGFHHKTYYIMAMLKQASHINNKLNIRKKILTVNRDRAEIAPSFFPIDISHITILSFDINRSHPRYRENPIEFQDIDGKKKIHPHIKNDINRIYQRHFSNIILKSTQSGVPVGPGMAPSDYQLMGDSKFIAKQFNLYDNIKKNYDKTCFLNFIRELNHYFSTLGIYKNDRLERDGDKIYYVYTFNGHPFIAIQKSYHDNLIPHTSLCRLEQVIYDQRAIERDTGNSMKRIFTFFALEPLGDIDMKNDIDYIEIN
jgi:hypothetical protein